MKSTLLLLVALIATTSLFADDTGLAPKVDTTTLTVTERPAFPPIFATAPESLRGNDASLLIDVQPFANELANLAASVCASRPAVDFVPSIILTPATKVVHLVQAGLTVKSNSHSRIALLVGRTGDFSRSNRAMWTTRLAMNW